MRTDFTFAVTYPCRFYLIDLEIEALESHFGVQLRDNEFDEDLDTVGGLVSRLAGRVPLRLDRLSHPSGLTFEIVDADPRRVKRVRVSTTSPAGETDRA